MEGMSGRGPARYVEACHSGKLKRRRILSTPYHHDYRHQVLRTIGRWSSCLSDLGSISILA